MAGKLRDPTLMPRPLCHLMLDQFYKSWLCFTEKKLNLKGQLENFDSKNSIERSKFQAPLQEPKIFWWSLTGDLSNV